MAGTEQQGFEVAPVRIGGNPGTGRKRPGRGRLPIVAVVVLALAIPAVALVGPRVEWRPEIDLLALLPSDPPPTPEPTRTPRPRITPVPTATPLPDVTLADGPRPADPLPVHVSAFRVIDPATGELSQMTNLRVDRDAIFAAPGGRWTCVCLDRLSQAHGETVKVTVRTLDRNLTERMRNEVATYRSEATPPAQDFGVRVEIERSPDGRFAYLAVAERRIDHWLLHVDTVDLAVGALVQSFDLGSAVAPAAVAPEPSASIDPGMMIDSYLGGPSIRLAPSGREAVVTGLVETYDPTKNESSSERFGWFVDVAADGASTGPATPMSAAWNEAMTMCSWLTWLTDDELVAQCWQAFRGAPGSTVNIRSFDRAAAITADVAVKVSPDWGIGEPLFDRANGTAWMWDPHGHVLHRVDLRTGAADRIDPDPDAPAPVPFVPPPTGETPEWVSALLPGQLWFGSPLAFGPGGTRIYAVGFSQDPNTGEVTVWPGGSSGIWVFDAASFALVDHWPAAAAYASVALSPDGRWLTAAGQAGIDVDGNPAGWSASVTIHDTTDGRVAIQLGSLGPEQVLLLP
jgi:hypothetical protein